MGDNWPRLVLTAGLIGAVSLLEAISIAKALAERNGDTVDADQELLGARLPLRIPISHHTPLAFQSSHSVATKQLPSEAMSFPKIRQSLCTCAGLGVCNLAGAVFCAYPSTGSFARSAVASTAGGKTGAHSHL